MNERIEKLAREAGYEIDVFGIIGHWDMPELRKYTELVVRECANVVFKNTGPRSALNVLEHFGLKDEDE